MVVGDPPAIPPLPKSKLMMDKSGDAEEDELVRAGVGKWEPVAALRTTADEHVEQLIFCFLVQE